MGKARVTGAVQTNPKATVVGTTVIRWGRWAGKPQVYSFSFHVAPYCEVRNDYDVYVKRAKEIARAMHEVRGNPYPDFPHLTHLRGARANRGWVFLPGNMPLSLLKRMVAAAGIPWEQFRDAYQWELVHHFTRPREA